MSVYSCMFKTMMGPKMFATRKHGVKFAYRAWNDTELNDWRRIERNGPNESEMFFHSIRFRINGTVTCYHYGKKIYAVDFVHNRVTDFGMGDYSASTRQHIREWSHTVHRYFNQVPLLWSWTTNEMARAYTRETFDDFIKKAPWIHWDKGTPWFAWEKLDRHLEKVFYDSIEYLRTSQNWRYFQFYWDSDGNWSRRFIDAGAERRFKRKEQRRDIYRRMAGIPGRSDEAGRDTAGDGGSCP